MILYYHVQRRYFYYRYDYISVIYALFDRHGFTLVYDQWLCIQHDLLLPTTHRIKEVLRLLMYILCSLPLTHLWYTSQITQFRYMHNLPPVSGIGLRFEDSMLVIFCIYTTKSHLFSGQIKSRVVSMVFT